VPLGQRGRVDGTGDETTHWIKEVQPAGGAEEVVDVGAVVVDVVGTGWQIPDEPAIEVAGPSQNRPLGQA